MTVVLAGLAGYILGATPTAIWWARTAGIDLRSQGSGNPGANNALRLGGPRLAALVLFTEMAKGAAAVLLGGQLADGQGMVLGGLGAVAGNLYNVFLGFKGGKGLGISAGVLLAAWPTVFIPILVIIALVTWLTHSSDAATLVALTTLLLLSVVWVFADLPTGWGVAEEELILALAVGLAMLIAPKTRSNISFRRPRPV